jgi:seryl-tRNA synthetase
MADKKGQPAQTQNDFDSAKMFVWVKALESKINNLMREVNSMKNDSILKINNLRHDMKTLNEDVLDIKQSREEITSKMDLIIKELKKTAGIEEVTVLKKYMEFWNPINFVTQNDLERAIQAKLSHMTNQINNQNIKNK